MFIIEGFRDIIKKGLGNLWENFQREVVICYYQ